MERLPCPRCKALSGLRHCKFGKSCTWRECVACVGDDRYCLYFNPKNGNYMLVRV